MASDILQVQEFLWRGLRSCRRFDAVNVVLEREFLARSEIEVDSLWLTPRMTNADGTPASPVGVGLIIEMPRLDLRNPNSLQRSLMVSVGIIEERNLNMTPSSGGAPGGTRISAEEWAETVLDFMFGWQLNASSALSPVNGTVKPARDLIEGDGLVAYRATVELRREHRPPDRCGSPMLSDAAPYVFTNGANSPDAQIYYMIASERGQLGLPCKDNSDATLWDGAPISIEAGSLISWAAWRDDLLPSHVKEKRF